MTITHDMIARGARVLAAWDGKTRAYDADRPGVRAYYERRAEGVLNAALTKPASDEDSR